VVSVTHYFVFAYLSLTNTSTHLITLFSFAKDTF